MEGSVLSSPSREMSETAQRLSLSALRSKIQ